MFVHPVVCLQSTRHDESRGRGLLGGLWTRINHRFESIFVRCPRFSDVLPFLYFQSSLMSERSLTDWRAAQALCWGYSHHHNWLDGREHTERRHARTGTARLRYEVRYKSLCTRGTSIVGQRRPVSPRLILMFVYPLHLPFITFTFGYEVRDIACPGHPVQADVCVSNHSIPLVRKRRPGCFVSQIVLTKNLSSANHALHCIMMLTCCINDPGYFQHNLLSVHRVGRGGSLIEGACHFQSAQAWQYSTDTCANVQTTKQIGSRRSHYPKVLTQEQPTWSFPFCSSLSPQHSLPPCP